MRNAMDTFYHLHTMNGKTIMEQEFEESVFLVEGLIGKGLALLAGAPKVGKSWLALWLTLSVARGDKVWGKDVEEGTTLYLCLEDIFPRIQQRLYLLTDEAPENTHFAISSGKLGGSLERELESFLCQHPDTKLITIDTLQMVRDTSTDNSYASDYKDLVKLKEIADKYRTTILLIHHLRKETASNPFDKISGTTGLQGVSDVMMVLEEQERGNGQAILTITGRDVPYQELVLARNEQQIWELISQTERTPHHPIVELVENIMEEVGVLELTPTEFVDEYGEKITPQLSPRTVRGLLSSQKTVLEKRGIRYKAHRTGEKNLILLSKTGTE